MAEIHFITFIATSWQGICEDMNDLLNFSLSQKVPVFDLHEVMLT